jgi:hypothetical protein
LFNRFAAHGAFKVGSSCDPIIEALLVENVKRRAFELNNLFLVFEFLETYAALVPFRFLNRETVKKDVNILYSL